MSGPSFYRYTDLAATIHMLRTRNITLLNPAGQDKPQQGITPTDYRQNRRVTIASPVPFTTANDRLLPDDVLKVGPGKVTLEVPAGGVRIVELK